MHEHIATSHARNGIVSFLQRRGSARAVHTTTTTTTPVTATAGSVGSVGDGRGSGGGGLGRGGGGGGGLGAGRSVEVAGCFGHLVEFVRAIQNEVREEGKRILGVSKRDEQWTDLHIQKKKYR